MLLFWGEIGISAHLQTHVFFFLHNKNTEWNRRNATWHGTVFVYTTICNIFTRDTIHAASSKVCKHLPQCGTLLVQLLLLYYIAKLLPFAFYSLAKIFNYRLPMLPSTLNIKTTNVSWPPWRQNVVVYTNFFRKSEILFLELSKCNFCNLLRWNSITNIS